MKRCPSPLALLLLDRSAHSRIPKCQSGARKIGGGFGVTQCHIFAFKMDVDMNSIRDVPKLDLAHREVGRNSDRLALLVAWRLWTFFVEPSVGMETSK